ncbi:hypothetical protein EJB05_00173, partial [Eragrostis curvula]
MMLHTALVLRKAFQSLESQDQKYTFAPSTEEWDSAEVLCKLLEEFNNATKLISGSQYPTSNLYFHQMWKIKMLLEKETTEADSTIKDVLTGMKKKFTKYWRKSYISLCVPVVFDPRYKLKFIEFLFSDSYPKTAKQKLDTIEGLVRGLYASYSSQVIDMNVGPSQVDGVDLPAATNDPWTAWDQQLSIDLQAQVSTELDRYLDENPIPRSKEFDVLQWWKGNSSKYPILARIARDVLAIPASSVASEAAFSTGKRIISDDRSSLAPETVEALICLQDWYRAGAKGGIREKSR